MTEGGGVVPATPISEKCGECGRRMTFSSPPFGDPGFVCPVHGSGDSE